MERVSPSMMPLMISWTWFLPVDIVPFFEAAAAWPSELPVRRTAYLANESWLSFGPIVKTAGREKESFSELMACKVMEKSNGVTDILVTFWKGITNAFFLIMTDSIPAPVMTRYELGSETWYLAAVSHRAHPARAHGSTHPGAILIAGSVY